MRTFSRALRICSAVVLFFFSWTYLPIFQIAAYAAETKQSAEDKGQSAMQVRTEGQKPEERFEKALEEIRVNVGKADEKAAKGEDASPEIKTIKTKKAVIESIDTEFKKEFAATEKKLKDANLPKEISDRHYKFVKHYESNLAALKSELDGIDTARTPAERKAKIEKARLHLEKVKPQKKHKPFSPDRLPTRTREIKPVRTSWVDRTMEWLVPSADAAEAPPTSADLAETLEAPQTQEIRDLAQKLGGTSVSLYEYVRNVYTYEPYAASTKGAVQTLREKSGNEWDQASLLIALYRASEIPARYVVGTVEIPIDSAMSWLGVEDARMAATLLSTLGRPTSLVVSGGNITAIRTQQVWVRAYVPFLFSRGATTGPGDMWVDVDPSFKGQTITKTLTVSSMPTFDQRAYLSTFRTDSPYDFYRSQLQTFLNANNPGYVPEALAWENEITPERFGVLIGQPPYIIKSVIGTYTEIPDSYRQKFTLSITDPSTGDSILSYSAPIPQIIGKRMTLSYIPATTADADVIANYGGLYSAPPYLVKLKPEIKIDGVSAIQGTAIGSGQEQNMTFVFDTTIDQGRVENTIIAGGYYAIGLSARSGDTRENILERTNQLATIAGTIDFNDPLTLDQKLGEILYLSATVYHQNLDAITKKIASLDHVVDVRDISEMMYFLTVKVDSVFGMPIKVTPAGITGDMDRNLHAVVPADGDTSHIKPFMQLVSTQSSYLEHDVTEKIYQTQGLSSVKAIQLANDQGIPVHTINNQNISDELPALQISSDVTADIANAINAGQEVIVPERNLTLGNWTGIGYIVQDPASGKGAYLISGGYGGIATIWEAMIHDLLRESVSTVAAQTANAMHRIQICYPGKDNLRGTSDDVCYGIYQFGELQDPFCNPDYDPECRGKYYYPHDDFVQYLIDIREHDPSIFLTKNITASDWQSQDNAPYMRAGWAALAFIEILMQDFHVAQHNLRSDSGSGYRTRERNWALAERRNRRVSYYSHHMDGVAADIVLDTPSDGYPVPAKCEVLTDAWYYIAGTGEVLHEGTTRSVHIAKPGKYHADAWRWRCN
jgi:transglutaminase-like putative cysteine protease